MKKNEMLYKKAIESIEDLFSDRSVSEEKTKEQLEELQDLINMMLSGLNE